MKRMFVFVVASLSLFISTVAKSGDTSRNTSNKYVLENTQVYYEFACDGSKLFIKSFMDKKNKMEFIENRLLPTELNNLWQINLRSEKSGREVILDEKNSSFEAVYKGGNNGRHLQFTWKIQSVDCGNIIVNVSAVVDNNSPFLNLKIDVENAGKEYGVWTVQFPVVNNFRKLSDSGEDFLAIAGGNGGGAGEGQLYKNPFSTLQTPHLRTYPCYHQAMQLNAYYGAEGGLYFATYDGDGYLKAFLLKPINLNIPVLRYEVHQYPESCGSAGLGFKQTYSAIISPFKGDWYDAARIYRQWALKQKWCKLGTLEQRTDISPSIKNGAYWVMFAPVFKPMAAGETLMRKLARTLPVEEVQKRARSWDVEASLAKVQQLHDYFSFPMILWCNNWWEGGGDISAPRYIPMNGLGEFMEKLHKRFPDVTLSGHIQPKRFSTQLLEFGEDVNSTLERRDNGIIYREVMSEDKDDIYVFPAWTTEWWLNFWRNKSYNLAKLGLDGFHVDEFASATSFSSQDFDKSHPRWGGGTVYADTRRNMYTIIRDYARKVNPNFAAHHEALCEMYIDVADLAEVDTTPANTSIPLWEAVYHDYNFNMGRRIMKWMDENTWPVGKEPGDANIGEFIASFGQTYIWGNQPGWTRADIVSFSPQAALYVKKLMDARYRAMKFLNTGDMMRQLTVTKPLPDIRTIWRVCDTPEHIMPAVINSVWKASDGTIGLVLVNISEEPQTITYRYDLGGCGIDGKKFILTRIDTPKRDRLESINGLILERSDTVEGAGVKIIEISPD
ncbi:MAG: DUF6259 domain-containing protein [Sedimentisphaerales bacterium]